MGFWPVVLNVLKNSDVLVLIADARVPEITTNKEIIKKASALNKELVLVLNKTDLLDKQTKEKIKIKYPNAFLTSEKNYLELLRLRKHLEALAEKQDRKSLRIGIVGYPNVGKSTIINKLIPKAKLKVSPISGTTKKTHWIRYKRLRIMDSPGVIPAQDTPETLGLISGKSPQKIKNPENSAIRIIEFLNKKDKNILKKFYNVNSDNDYNLFLQIGKKKGYLLKKGEVDEQRTAIKIIEDWQKGKIPLKA